MNIIQVNSKWVSGLGNLSPVATTFIKWFGPIATTFLGGLFLFILIKNIIPITKGDTPPAEKEAAKKSLLLWGIGLFAVLAGAAIVTGIFFGLGHDIQQVTNGSGAGGATSPNPTSGGST